MRVVVVLLFSTFFSNVRVTFISSGGLHIRLSHAGGNAATHVLALFCSHPRSFVSALLIKGGVTLIICNVLVTSIISDLVVAPLRLARGRKLRIILRALVSALVILIAKRFLPGALFGVGPGRVLRVFSIPTFIVCVLLCPMSGFADTVSHNVL